MEQHHPELGVITGNMESLSATGNHVGASEQVFYGTPEPVEIPFSRRMSGMVRETSELIEQSVEIPIFEATCQYHGVLVRVDI